MALFKRYQPPQPAPTRPPDEDGLLNWILREAHPFLIQTQRWLSRCVSYMGKVGVDDTDYPGVAEDKLVATTGVTITKTGAAGDRQLTFGANATEITTIVNTTIIETAAVTGATLYPAATPDPLLRTACTGYTSLGAGYGLVFADWTQIGGMSTWQKNNTDIVNRYKNTGNVVATVGERLFVDCVVTGTHQYDGIYEVVVQGDAVSSHAVIRRVSDANTPSGLCHNMVVQVQDIGDGTSTYRTLTTADPVTVDTTSMTFSSGAYSAPSSTSLLTNSQVALASTLTCETGAAVRSSGPNDTLLMASGSWVTLAGTPGASSIPAGKFSAQILAYVTVADLATPPRIDIKLRTVHLDGSSDATYITLSSPPITATTPTLYTFEANLAAPVTISPTDRQEALAYAHATGTGYVDVRLVWNNAARDTHIVTTLALGGFGGGVHNDLTGLSMAACGRYDAILGEGILSELTDDVSPPEAQPPLDSGAITSGSGVVDIDDGTFNTDETLTIRWPAGLWNMRVKCAATSLASASYVRATLYRVDTGTPTTIGWTHDFRVASTDTANGSVVVFGIVLPELVDSGALPLLRLVLQAKTDSGSAVHVYVIAATVETPLMIRQRYPTLSQLGGVPTTRTINGQDLTANRTIPTAGRLVARTIYTSGSASTHTFTAGIASAIIDGIAGGGGGGGGTFSSPNMAFGGGGAAGGNFAVRITGTFTTATYTVGGGGAGGGTGGDGNAGNDTIFVCNGTTYTAKGGLGGVGQSAGTGLSITLGGAGVAGTNGDINCPGSPGQPGIRLSGILGASGAGAPSILGGGGGARKTNGSGNSAVSYGAGGGGGAAVSASQNGGSGFNGIVIITEYSA